MKQFLFKNIAYPFARLYWKLFKPTTRGVRGLVMLGEKVLLVQHINNSYWSLPGGGIGKNEDPYKGLLRELREELQLLSGHITSSYEFGTYINDTEGKRDSIIIFIIQVSDFKITTQYELKNAKWFPINNLPENVSPATKRRITEYLSGESMVRSTW